MRVGARRSVWLAGAVVVLLGVVGALLVLEVYLRVTGGHDLDVLTGRVVGPNPMRKWARVDPFAAYVPRLRDYGAGKTVSPQGFISTPAIDPDGPRPAVRLLYLGGSSTAGTGLNLPDEQTWPWQATERLRALTGLDIDFVNAAVPGYTSFESYGRLWARLRHLAPDVIVVYHGWNELYYFDEVDSIHRWRTLSDGSWTLDRAERAVVHIEPRWIDPFISPSRALSAIRLLLAEPLGEVGVAQAAPLGTTFDERGLEVWRTNLRLLAAAAEILDAELVVAKQATLVVEDASRCAAACRYEYHGFDHAAHVAAFAGLYAVIDEEIPASHVIDATPLSGDRGLLVDHVHPSPRGARELAVLAADRLAPIVRARARR